MKTRSDSGQAIIEYILLLSMIMSMAGLIVASVRGNRDRLWKTILCEVSAACPDCRATDSAKDALKNSGVSCKQ